MKKQILLSTLFIFTVACNSQKSESPAAKPTAPANKDIPTQQAADASSTINTATNNQVKVGDAPAKADAKKSSKTISPPIVEQKVKPETEEIRSLDLGSLSAEKQAKDVQNELDTKAKNAENDKTDKRTRDEKANWTKLIEYIHKNGVDEESQTGVYTVLKDVTSEKTDVAREGYFISGINGSTNNGTTQYSRIEAVWEKWTDTSDGNLAGDQWMVLLARNGQVAEQWHYHFIEKRNNTVLKHEAQKTTKEEANKKWNLMKDHWYKKMKK